MKQTRKLWTRNYFLARLEVVQETLDQIDKLAEAGGDMPRSLRNRVKATSLKIQGTTIALRSWLITAEEKAEAELRRSKGYAER